MAASCRVTEVRPTPELSKFTEVRATQCKAGAAALCRPIATRAVSQNKSRMVKRSGMGSIRRDDAMPDTKG